MEKRKNFFGAVQPPFTLLTATGFCLRFSFCPQLSSHVLLVVLTVAQVGGGGLYACDASLANQSLPGTVTDLRMSPVQSQQGKGMP